MLWGYGLTLDWPELGSNSGHVWTCPLRKRYLCAATQQYDPAGQACPHGRPPSRDILNAKEIRSRCRRTSASKKTLFIAGFTRSLATSLRTRINPLAVSGRHALGALLICQASHGNGFQVRQERVTQRTPKPFRQVTSGIVTSTVATKLIGPLALDGRYNVGHANRVTAAAQGVAASGSPCGFDQLMLPKFCKHLLQVGQRNPMSLRQIRQRHGLAALAQCQLNQHVDREFATLA